MAFVEVLQKSKGFTVVTIMMGECGFTLNAVDIVRTPHHGDSLFNGLQICTAQQDLATRLSWGFLSIFRLASARGRLSSTTLLMKILALINLRSAVAIAPAQYLTKRQRTCGCRRCKAREYR